MNTTNFPGRVEKRKVEAEQRREAWGSMTPQEQLKALDARLGVGEGAVKQRERLVKQMATVVAKAASLTAAKDAKEEKAKPKAKERRQAEKAAKS